MDLFMDPVHGLPLWNQKWNLKINGRVCINKLLLLSGLWATHITHSLVQTFPEFHTNVKGLG